MGTTTINTHCRNVRGAPIQYSSMAIQRSFSRFKTHIAEKSLPDASIINFLSLHFFELHGNESKSSSWSLRDLSMKNLKPGTSSWNAVRDQVYKALEEFGCFEAVFDGASLQTHNDVFVASKELLDLPFETKRLNDVERPFYGYTEPSPAMPLHEGLGIDEVLDIKHVEKFTNLMWPQGNTKFCETIHSFAKQMAVLEKTVKKMIFESLGVEKYYNSFDESTEYLLRLLKYWVPQRNETTLSVPPHSDKSGFTILHTNRVAGLEIETKDGEWICYTPSIDQSFLVFVGEAFMAWSNGRLHCAHHRVTLNRNREIGTERYTMALFACRGGTIEVPEELVDEEHPLQFKPFDLPSLSRFCTTEEGKKAKYAIKAYCGI